MSEILSVIKLRGRVAWWIILDCGHWYKWSGEHKPPRVGKELDCPSCKQITVVPGTP